MQNKQRVKAKTAMLTQASEPRKKPKTIREIRALLKDYAKICAGVDTNKIESIEDLSHLSALYCLYRNGDKALGIEADLDRADKYLFGSADNGHILAMIVLAKQHLKSDQVLANNFFVEAFKEYECLPETVTNCSFAEN